MLLALTLDVRTSYTIAVVLALVGAVLFGLASLRQHGAVQHSMHIESTHGRLSLRAFGRMVRRPAWLIGTFQGLVAGALHVLALAFGPIALVQPIGVLAVPTTVVASAIAHRQRPSRLQLVGSALSVLSIAGLTYLLMSPETDGSKIPGAAPVAWTTAGALLFTVLVAVLGRAAPPLVRCTLLACAAAALFGLTSPLFRALGEVFTSGAVDHQVSLVVTCLVGLVLLVPTGTWATQTAYASGSAHVVICCLTLIDPLTAVALGRILLGEGSAISSGTIAAASVCALAAVAGVLCLARDYPVNGPLDAEPGVPSGAGAPAASPRPDGRATGDLPVK